MDNKSVEREATCTCNHWVVAWWNEDENEMHPLMHVHRLEAGDHLQGRGVMVLGAGEPMPFMLEDVVGADFVDGHFEVEPIPSGDSAGLWCIGVVHCTWEDEGGLGYIEQAMVESADGLAPSWRRLTPEELTATALGLVTQEVAEWLDATPRRAQEAQQHVER